MVFLLMLLSVVSCSRAFYEAPIGTSTPSIASYFTNTMTVLPIALSTTLTSTTEPIVSPTLTPTIPGPQVEANILELLRTNAGCIFPCWWGIIPGLTSWNDAKLFLLNNGIGINPDATAQFITQAGVINDFEFYLRNGNVDIVQITSESIQHDQAFRQLWINYAPEAIIAKFGQPSQVLVETASEGYDGTPKDVSFDIWLFYAQQGFLIRYSGFVNNVATYRFCPTFDANGSSIYSLRIILSYPGNKTPLTYFTQLPSPYVDRSLDLGQASGITVGEFYDLYQQTSKPICIETPRDIWK
jgi:hypothetical protein